MFGDHDDETPANSLGDEPDTPEDIFFIGDHH